MKTAKLFANGQSQAVRLPKDYRFSGDEVGIMKVGEVVMLYPTGGKWERFISTEPLTNDVGAAILDARQDDSTVMPRETL